MIAGCERALGSPWIGWIGVIGALGHGLSAPRGRADLAWGADPLSIHRISGALAVLAGAWPAQRVAPRATVALP